MQARTVAALVIAAFGLAAPRITAAQTCDRACLTGILNGYFTALAAHDPSKVAVADGIRITEDTKESTLRDGLWKNISALRPHRQDFIDLREGAAVAFAVAEEAGKPALVAVRLKVVNRKITEIGVPNALVTFEAFKVYGGKIHAAEAILETLPVGAPSGWDR